MSFVSLYLYVPDEGSLLPKYRDCTTYNDFELYLMCCGVMLLLLIIYICICIYIYIYIYATQHIKYDSKSLEVVQSLYFGSKLPSSGTCK